MILSLFKNFRVFPNKACLWGPYFLCRIGGWCPDPPVPRRGCWAPVLCAAQRRRFRKVPQWFSQGFAFWQVPQGSARFRRFREVLRVFLRICLLAGSARFREGSAKVPRRFREGSAKVAFFLVWLYHRPPQEILRKFSGDSQEVLRKFSGSSQEVLRKLSARPPSFTQPLVGVSLI